MAQEEALVARLSGNLADVHLLDPVTGIIFGNRVARAELNRCDCVCEDNRPVWLNKYKISSILLKSELLFFSAFHKSFGNIVVDCHKNFWKKKKTLHPSTTYVEMLVQTAASLLE